MLFNSIGFTFFLPVVFILYWFVFTSRKQQNLLIFFASYFFYACWDYRFLALLAFSTLLDYYTGIRIHHSQNKTWRKIWLLISVCINLGFLGFFKYYNFFTKSFAALLSKMGFHPDPWMLDIVLPVGISFYTFHGLSYVFDIYNKKITPEKGYINYSVFVSFFPLLVAGPIERATHLLPQILKSRVFNYTIAVDGMRQILWGLFKKVVVADSCAVFVNDIFQHYPEYSGSTLWLGAFLFSIQIYGDFSGYSDIALGIAKLFGFELLRNFSYPYFSRDIAEFWRRWHISLTTWFRDYVYYPLGGNRNGLLITVRNTMIIFLVSGFWHGSKWTFIVWGLLNAIYFLPLLLLNRNRKNLTTVAENKWLPGFKELVQMLVTFFMATVAWVFFRANSVAEAFAYFKKMFSSTVFTSLNIGGRELMICLCMLTVMIISEWMQREKLHALQFSNNANTRVLRWSCYLALGLLINMYFGSENTFIYFQF